MSAKCFLFGTLTRDPEMRYTPKGVAVGEIGIAVNHTWKNEAGEKMEETSFFNLVAFGRTAETIAQYMRKGDKPVFWTRPKMERWDDKQTGNPRTAIKFIVESFEFGLKGKASREAQEEQAGEQPGQGYDNTKTARQNARAQAPPETEEPPLPSDDDVPF